MGLGFRDNVAASSSYPTVVDSMVQQGLIEAPVFSLFLVRACPVPPSAQANTPSLPQDNLDAKSGTILFGGIDSQKYHGRLATLPLVSDDPSRSGNRTSYTVRLRGFNVDGIDLDLDNLGAAAVLDSGSTISLLPDSLVREMHRHFGVRFVQDVSIPLVDCAYRAAKGKGVSFQFRFDGATIRVPVAEMVIDAFPEHDQRSLRGSQLRRLFGQWDRVCIFGIGSAADYGIKSESFALLGDTFLRSAYVVYDMANRQLGIAQANTKADKSNIVEIRKGATQIPDVAGVPGTFGPDAHLGAPKGHVLWLTACRHRTGQRSAQARFLTGWRRRHRLCPGGGCLRRVLLMMKEAARFKRLFDDGFHEHSTTSPVYEARKHWSPHNGHGCTTSLYGKAHQYPCRIPA